MIARILMTGSAAVVLSFGIIHLVYTFRGAKLAPRDQALQQRMQQVSPVITSETTMWKTRVGINATHSLTLILFGLVYGSLALSNAEFLFSSPALLIIGGAMLLSVAIIAKLYFFSVPFRGICFAMALCLASTVLSRFNTA